MKIINEIHSIEKYQITSEHSFYKQLKVIIKQADLVTREIFNVNSNPNPFNGILLLENKISNRIVCFNSNLINFSNSDTFEIERQIKIDDFDVSAVANNQRIIDLVYEHEQLSSVIETQFINWWEENIKNFVVTKYSKMEKANSICQFARQIRNGFGHSGISINVNNCPDPIWNSLNLKNYQGEKIFSLITIADLINFWIEFEEVELNN
ncbi:hypothetical protein [Flavobacterium sp. ZB4R12]|uniref:hypothetical protein n=1 Tax=Flavobacterium sp. ZB4R12 TaxID=3398732 RepID=UPI003AAE0680